MRSVHLVVHGKVQGVFYRNWTVQNARELDLCGWVRNRPDGSVEAVLQGDVDRVEEMIGRMRSGPPAARVDNVDIADGPANTLDTFDRR